MTADSVELYSLVSVSKLADIPATWWDEVLDGRPFMVDLLTFVSKDPFNLRTLLYRRAASRRRYVKVSIDLENELLYLQAYQFKGEQLVGFKTHSQLVPAVPRLRVRNRAAGQGEGSGGQLPVNAPTIRQQRRACTCGTRHFRDHAPDCALLQPLMDREGVSAPPPPRQPPEQVPPGPVREVPTGWIQSRYSGCLLPPGVPDIDGAFYPDAPSEQEIIALAAQFEDAFIRCTCGTPDLRFHDQGCAVDGDGLPPPSQGDSGAAVEPGP